MKKALLVLLLCPLCSAAKNPERSARRDAVRAELFASRHQLQVGIGAYPLNPFTFGGSSHDFADPVVTAPIMPIYHVQYLYRVKRGFQIGATLAANPTRYTYSPRYLDREKYSWSEWEENMGVQIDLRWHYFNSRLVTLYGSAGGGVVFNFNGPVKGLFGFSPLGIAVGRTWFGYAECGFFGVRGMIHGGVGYRF